MFAFILRVLVFVLILVSFSSESFARGGLIRRNQKKAPPIQLPSNDHLVVTNNLNLPKPIKDYRFDYGDTSDGVAHLEFKGGRMIVIVANKRLTESLKKTLKLEIDDAYKLIQPLGLNKKPVVLCVVSEIKPNFPVKENIEINGLMFEYDSKLHIAMRENRIRFDYIAHEICHLRIREEGWNVSWWIDEGISECFESWNYEATDHLETLRKSDPVTLEELKNYSPLQGKEELIRATAWAICYDLMIIRKTYFCDLERVAGSVDPKSSVRKVLEVCSKNK